MSAVKKSETVLIMRKVGRHPIENDTNSVLMQMVNGSVLTTVLRLRGARRELADKREQEILDVIDLPTRPILTAVAA